MSKWSNLEEIARQVRVDVLTMVHLAGSGHVGPSLSATEVVVALYFSVLRVRPSEPSWPERDRFVLSKGHAAPLLYSVLARKGFVDPENMRRLRRLHSPFQGHPDARVLPGLDASTGSLGQGLSIAAGLAMGARLSGRDCRVYALLGDGECQEGQVWEAAMSAAKYRLDNLTAIVDVNGGQADGRVADIMPVEPLAGKWASFGWEVAELDGHSFAELVPELQRRGHGGPRVVLARTVKGKGVSFMENDPHWHSSPVGRAEYEAAMRELSGR